MKNRVILFENQIQTTSASPCRTQVLSVASFLVCFLIFIEYKYPPIQHSAFTLGLKYDKIEYQLVEVKKMTVKINTKDGQIELTDEVIATVVGGAATEIFGVVGMASKNALKDNFQALLGKENYSKGVVVKAAEDGSIAVDVYTVLSYGTQISEVSKNIQERVRFSLENQLGITAQTVNVYIQNIKVVGE